MAEEKRKPGRPPGSKSSSTRSNKDKSASARNKGSRVRDEISAIIILALGTFLVVALQTNAAGIFGEVIKNFLLGSFGLLTYILPYYLIVYGILLFAKKTTHINVKSMILLFLIFLMGTLLNSVRYIDLETFSFALNNWAKIFDAGAKCQNGGFFGMIFGALLVKIIGKMGLCILAVVVITISLMLVINTPLSQFIEDFRKKHAEKVQRREELYEQEEIHLQEENEISMNKKDNKVLIEKERSVPIITGSSRQVEKPDIEPPLNMSDPKKINESKKKILSYMKDDELFERNIPTQGFGLDGLGKVNFVVDQNQDITNQAVSNKDKISNKEAKEATLSKEELSMSQPSKLAQYSFPSIELLKKSLNSDKPGLESDLNAKAMKLEQTLQNFHVDARVVQVTQGPAVTRYEIQPNVGVKVNSIVRLSDDIALNLEAKSIRIEAPIPGKAAVGIEVENDKVNMVTLREIVGSKEFKNAKSKITFAVGKDIAGNAITADLKGMPHMLIAGSTGSGKSVCINSIITSILYKAKPEEVKLVLVDPKVVELGNYNGIPHLLIPVVTEPGKAAAALNWAVAEMNDRYKKFAEEGVRDLESFNDAVSKKEEEDRFLPQIVIIIDELADLMMAAPSQVEESICRLAQMARAAGMHLIVATQRPSVDIITGVIKANIPSRIAFAVSSQFDSRTILDMAGAEKLVGKGDMLFHPLGMGKPIRVQGTFVSDDEVNAVINHVKSQLTEVEYSSDVIHTIEHANTPVTGEDADELLPQAIETVVKSGQASVSMVQRRFRVGYNRAARIVDMMEARGIIGPADGSRPRQVLMTEQELNSLNEETSDLRESDKETD